MLERYGSIHIDYGPIEAHISSGGGESIGRVIFKEGETGIRFILGYRFDVREHKPEKPVWIQVTQESLNRNTLSGFSIKPGAIHILTEDPSVTIHHLL